MCLLLSLRGVLSSSAGNMTKWDFSHGQVSHSKNVCVRHGPDLENGINQSVNKVI
jgi:hypothetical protein